MKIAITAAVFLTALSVSTTYLGAQSTGSPAEIDFVSGGKVEMTLESGDYNIRASSDSRIHVRWNEASARGVRVKLTTNGKSADLRVENTPHNNFHATLRSRRLLTCASDSLPAIFRYQESKATRISKPMPAT
jgi:hypothetical protein